MDDISLYSLLKNKAEDYNIKNDIMYIEMHKQKTNYTYYDVFEFVNKYVEFFLKCNYKGKILFVFVDNSVKSIAVFIAMLKVGIIPVLVNPNNFYSRTEARKNDIEYKKNSIDFFDATSLGIYSSSVSVYLFEKYANSLNIKLNDLIDNEKRKFVIQTSGSTSGKPKLVVIYEKDILNKNEDLFNSIQGEYLYTYIPISSISSIVYNILAPLFLNKKILLSSRLDLLDIQEKNISLLIPRNILDILNEQLNERYYYSNANYSNINKMYLSGEINSLKFIKNIREKIPTLRENIFTNLYGSTEALGIISYCEEKKLIPIYINQLALSNGNFIYTYDKMNFFERNFDQDNFYDKKVNLEYDEFLYFECLPVSECKVKNLKIKNNLGEIIFNNNPTGDIGVYVNDKLYIICRTDDIVNIDGKTYYLPLIENLFFNLTGLKTYALKYENQIFVIINFILDKSSITNIKDIISLIKISYEFSNRLSFLPLAFPIFVDSDHLPKSEAMKKTIKKNLISLIKNRKKFEYYIDNYQNAFICKIQSLINNITNANKELLEYQGNNIFKIKKSDSFGVKQLMLLYKQVDADKLYEDNEYFYITISDGIIIDSIMKQDYWTFKDIEYMSHIYNRDLNKFYNIINEKKCDLVIIGKRQFENDKIKFIPVLIDRRENVHPKYFDSSVYFFIFYSPYKGKVPNDNKKIENKINILKQVFNHEYSINSYGDFFIDNIKTEKKRHIIYRELFSEITNHSEDRFQEIAKYQEVDIHFFDYINQLILVLNHNFENIRKWCQVFLEDIYNLQYEKNCVKNKFKNKEEQLKEMIKKIYISNNNPILVVGGLDYYNIKNDDKNSMLEMFKNEMLKCFLELVQLMRSKGIVKVKINEKYVDIDFSKLKIVYMILDEELYNNPTIDKCIELGYPEEIINRIDRVVNFYDLFKEHKNNKVKRKELK